MSGWNLLRESLDVHRIDWLVVFAYFDGGTGGARNELTIVAGYLFDRDGVGRFQQLYSENVEPILPPNKRGQKVFHAAPCFDGDDEYFHIQRPIREAIIGRMAAAIRESVSLGVVVAIEKSEYERGLQGRYIGVNINGVKAQTLEPWAGSKYSICLVRCIHGLNGWLDKQNLDGTVEYVMEGGETPSIEEETTTILSRLAVSPLRTKYRIGKYGFVPKGSDTPWLCAADYLAWAWQTNDRVSEQPDRDFHGDWETALIPLLENKPHMASYLTEQSVNTQALVNLVNGLKRPVSGGP